MASLKFKNPETGEWDKLGFPMPEIPEGMQMELLWENASPTSEFAAQTVELDLNGYDRYGVEYYLSAAGKNAATAYATSGTNLIMMGNDVNNIYRRVCTYADNGLSFASGARAGTTDNTAIVPIRIYGIKGITDKKGVSA